MMHFRDFTRYGLATLVGLREKRELEVLQGKIVRIESDPEDESHRDESHRDESCETADDERTP